MAIKHFLKYYEEVENSYLDMMQELRDMEKSLQEEDELVDPEMVEQMKVVVQPIKENYRTLCYVKFLLDMPAKKEKEKRYEAQNRKLLANAKTAQDVKGENDQAFKELREFKNES